MTFVSFLNSILCVVDLATSRSSTCIFRDLFGRHKPEAATLKEISKKL